MNDEMNEALDKVYEDLKQTRDQIELKMKLGGMELRDRWNQLDSEWTNWTHQLSKELNAEGEEFEKRLREAGGDDLRKLEIASRVKVSKLKREFKEFAKQLEEDSRD